MKGARSFSDVNKYFLTITLVYLWKSLHLSEEQRTHSWNSSKVSKVWAHANGLLLAHSRCTDSLEKDGNESDPERSAPVEWKVIQRPVAHSAHICFE